MSCGLVAAMLAGWASAASPDDMPDRCSAADTRKGTIQLSPAWKAGGGTWSGRYCGRGRAVIKVGGRTIIISGGHCTSTRARFGLLGAADGAKGIWLLFEPNRVGENNVADGGFQAPGIPGEIALGGTVIRKKGLNTATFTLFGRSGANLKLRGSFTCGTFL